MGGTEIKRSIRQSQFLGAAIVTPATATGADRVAVLHDEFAGAELHVMVRHGEFHGRLVVWFGVFAVVVARADGLAVQAVDLGAGGDGHGGACVDVEVLAPKLIHRHIVDFLDRGNGRIQSNGVGIFCRFWGRLAVEHAARNRSAGEVCHTALEGSTRDFSFVSHFILKDAAGNIRTRFNLNLT